VTASVQQPGSFGWLFTDFVHRVPGVAHAVVVSADGLLLAGSHDLPRDRAEQLSAIVSGLVSLTEGCASRKLRPSRSGSISVLVRDSAEPVAATYPEEFDLGRFEGLSQGS
jgi:hypothetical protein